MSAEDVDVIGFRVMDAATNKPISRRYNVKAAAEEFASLALREYPTAYVQDVMGPAEAALPGQRRKRAA